MKQKIVLFIFAGMLALSPATAVFAEEFGPGYDTRAGETGRIVPFGYNNRVYRRNPNWGRTGGRAGTYVPQDPASPGTRFRYVPGPADVGEFRSDFYAAPGAYAAPDMGEAPGFRRSDVNAAQEDALRRFREAESGGGYFDANAAQEDALRRFRGAESERGYYDVNAAQEDALRRFREAESGRRYFDANAVQEDAIRRIHETEGIHDYGYNTGRRRDLLSGTAVPGEIDIFNVSPGDTLWEISQKYKLRLEAVIDANPELDEPDLIYPGDKIKVPLDDSVDDNMDIGGARSYSGARLIIRRVALPSVVAPGVAAPSAATPGVAAPSAVAPVVPASANTMEREILSLVNKERAKAGVAQLGWSEKLAAVARAKSQDMSQHNYFSHQSRIYGGPFEMMKAFGISYRTAGENIAKGQKTATAVMTAWMSSAEHKKNILNPKFTEIGVGHSVAGNGTVYWTQMFVG